MKKADRSPSSSEAAPLSPLESAAEVDVSRSLETARNALQFGEDLQTRYAQAATVRDLHGDCLTEILEALQSHPAAFQAICPALSKWAAALQDLSSNG